MAKSVDARDLKSLGTSRAGSIPAERTKKLLWCNSHQRRAEECKYKGGILLPCVVVDLTDMLEIED